MSNWCFDQKILVHKVVRPDPNDSSKGHNIKVKTFSRVSNCMSNNFVTNLSKPFWSESQIRSPKRGVVNKNAICRYYSWNSLKFLWFSNDK